MGRDYDAAIAEHYAAVAHSDGLSSSSTMADEVIRRTETDSILAFVASALKARRKSGPALIADVGCGNGYTLGLLAKAFPKHKFVGIELSNELRGLAEKRIAQDKLKNASVRTGNVRDGGFAKPGAFDILVCQRVLINLMDAGDQKTALGHIMGSVRAGGGLIFLEAFTSPLERINAARAEFDLTPIPVAHHNLYLRDDFFSDKKLKPWKRKDWTFAPNQLSTHYFISRVFCPALWGAKPFVRNSHMATFFSQALPPAIGDYGQVRILAFEKGR
ncbi:MAG: class I SAM-dependent methyltransferase [Pseudomonadota bacterium]|nr:class I SAM-dependent methyltransferase [Pseudomonadota bacterium]